MSSSTLITDYLGSGVIASRPTTPPVPTGGSAFYYATDTLVLYFWSGSAWVAVPSGTSTVNDPSIAPNLIVPANPGFDPSLVVSGVVTLSNSNKTATPASSSPFNYLFGTTARYTGKWYHEVVVAGSSLSFVAVGYTGPNGHYRDGGTTGSFANLGAFYSGQVGWQTGGTVTTVKSGADVNAPLTLGTAAAFATTNVLGMAIDIDNALAWFRVGSGNWNNSGTANPTTGAGGFNVSSLFNNTASRLVWPAMNAGSTSAQTMHLLSADFANSAPSGFSSWSGL